MYSLYNKNSIINIPVTRCLSAIQRLFEYETRVLLESLQQTRVNDWQRCARGIISLLKVYNDDLIDKACHRALHYGISSYSKIKNILNSNAVNLPLPEFGGNNAELI